ncbi:MAG TPA: hypothetical protein VGK41_07605 [Solirubrobacterales bacterium]
MLTVKDVEGSVSQIEELLNESAQPGAITAADEQRADLFEDVVQAIADGAEDPLGLCAAAVGQPVPERQALALTPQAQAVIAGMLDPSVRELEQETGEGQVFAGDDVWAEVRAMFPPIVYRRRLNDEGQIA